RAYCLKTQPATGETYPKSDLFNKAHESLSAFIIKRTNLSRSYVYQVLAALREGGYITVKKGKLISIDRHIPEKF
ncbi:helix-turn-helix domain-containing protein, partial [Klebsiella pneumoniae]